MAPHLPRRCVRLPLFDVSGRFAGIDASSEDALRHYLRRGWRDGVAFRAEPSAGDYLDQVSFVAQLGISPLYHYASQQRLCRGEGEACARYRAGSPKAAAEWELERRFGAFEAAVGGRM